MPNSFTEEVLIVRKTGGFAHLDQYGVIEISGVEAPAFLQGRVTNDVLSLLEGTGQPSCLLERKGHLLACFSLHRDGNRYLILAERQQIPVILGQLEFYHFAEKVDYRDCSADGQMLTIQGPQALSLLADSVGGNLEQVLRPYSVTDTTFGGIAVVVFNRSLTGEDGFFLWVANDKFASLAQMVKEKALNCQMINISAQALDVLRIEAGIPKMFVDMSDTNLLPETALDHTAVSYTKGCYIGQEVLARIRSHGAPKRGLVGLVFADAVDLQLPFDAQIALEGKEIGQLKSHAYSPTLKKLIALAYVSRDFRVPDTTLNLNIDGKNCQATVVTLPFCHAAKSAEHIRKVYDQALSVFANGDELQAVAMLRQVIKLDPLFVDAYESLGVILARHEQLDEAIVLMQKLTELDSASIMAHTNLSIFYMQKGWKEKAEDEKALAMSVRMDLLSKQMTAEKQAADEKQKKIETATQRLAMFEQVLEIDAEDLLANYGLGSCFVDLEKFSQAVPYLKKAITVKPDYTVAYLALGQAYTAQNQVSEAADIYNKGIEVAAKRGDLMPMQQMQALLHNLCIAGEKNA